MAVELNLRRIGLLPRRTIARLLAILAIISLPSAVALAQLPPGNWHLRFADEFNGNSLDLIKWSYNYPWGQRLLDSSDVDPLKAGKSKGLWS